MTKNHSKDEFRLRENVKNFSPRLYMDTDTYTHALSRSGRLLKVLSFWVSICTWRDRVRGVSTLLKLLQLITYFRQSGWCVVHSTRSRESTNSLSLARRDRLVTDDAHTKKANINNNKTRDQRVFFSCCLLNKVNFFVVLHDRDFSHTFFVMWKSNQHPGPLFKNQRLSFKTDPVLRDSNTVKCEIVVEKVLSENWFLSYGQRPRGLLWSCRSKGCAWMARR